MSEQHTTTSENTQQIELFQPDAYLTPFDRIAHDDGDGQYWSARELIEAQEYVSWRNFTPAIEKAKRACEKAGYRVEDHFVAKRTMIQVGKGGQREVDDYQLSRYACYLVAINGDTSKPLVAQAQTYFLHKAREAELRDEYEREQRQLKRGQAMTGYITAGHSAEWAERRVDSKDSVKALNGAAMLTHEHHAPDFGKLHSAINAGLFDMTKSEIVQHLGLQPKDADKYRDHLGTYALDTLKRVNEASARKMKQFNRSLTDDEQTAIVKVIVKIVAPGMYELAAYVGVDFVSGAALDDNGKPQIGRNVPLLMG